MSQDTENTPDTGAAPDPTPEAAAPKRTIKLALDAVYEKAVAA